MSGLEILIWAVVVVVVLAILRAFLKAGMVVIAVVAVLLLTGLVSWKEVTDTGKTLTKDLNNGKARIHASECPAQPNVNLVTARRELNQAKRILANTHAGDPQIRERELDVTRARAKVLRLEACVRSA